jgi:hypothetical protein
MNHKLAPLTGLLFFALLAAGTFVEGSDTPHSDDDATKVLAYYQAHDTRIGIAAALTVLAVFVGVIFYAAILMTTAWLVLFMLLHRRSRIVVGSLSLAP